MLEVEKENLEVEEMANLTNSYLGEGKRNKTGRKSYKDMIWQWDDASWMMCAVLMTFTMQVQLRAEVLIAMVMMLVILKVMI